MGQLQLAAAGRLIGAHPNIYFLTSHAKPVFINDRGSDLPWSDLFAGNALSSRRRELILRHPDRFILAFDNVYGEDRSDHYVRQVRLWREALADLPADVAHAVAHGNAERLWRLPPAGRRCMVALNGANTDSAAPQDACREFYWSLVGAGSRFPTTRHS